MVIVRARIKTIYTGVAFATSAWTMRAERSLAKREDRSRSGKRALRICRSAR
jgi:hypothetical protein